MDDLDVEGLEDVKESWADECLDEELKGILSEHAHGRLIEVDIVSHLEYFYNTLDCDFTTKNPFDEPEAYPALLYKTTIVSSEGGSSGLSPGLQNPLQQVSRTLLQMHRLIIFPNSQPGIGSKNLSKRSKGSSSSPDVSPTVMLQVNGQFS